MTAETSETTASAETLAAVAVAIEDPAAPVHGSTLLDFKHELARAMRSAAEAERERITASVAAAAETHLGKIRTRAAAEADGFRQLADEDVDRIRDWSTAEVARIHEEAERRIGARRQQLDRHIEQHGSITDREIASVESAVEGYRSELDRFFARLTSEEDPAEFATLAGTMPGPPDLDEIGGEARARALDEFRAAEAAPEARTTDAEGRPSAFSPTEPGPGLVGVMAAPEPGSEEQPTASGEPAAVEPAPDGGAIMGRSDAEAPGEQEQQEASGTLQRLRVLAGLSGQKRQDERQD